MVPVTEEKYVTWLAHALFFAWVLAGAPPASASQDLADATIEELLQTKVTSVAKKSQTAWRTAAAVYVIAQEDIRRSGATTIPDLLRMAPGVNVARIDSTRWAISVRGFNAEFSNKLLVLIDGRSVYTPVYSGVFWDVSDTLVEDIDRIEVIRGPGATMWGANAVNAVINIITKHSRATQGTMMMAGSGSEEQAIAAVRTGGSVGPAVTYRAYARFSNRNELSVRPAGHPPVRDWRAVRGGFRMDADLPRRGSLLIQGEGYGNKAGETVTFPTRNAPFQQTREFDIDASGGHLLARWARQDADGYGPALQVYADYSSRFTLVSSAVFVRTLDTNYEHRLKIRRHDLFLGGGFRVASAGVRVFGRDFPEDLNQLKNVFLQDELEIAEDRLYVTGGLKVEHNNYGGTYLQPTARVSWLPARHQTVWAAISRAVRTASRIERDLNDVIRITPLPRGFLATRIVGNRALEPENVIAYEAGYRRQVGRFITLDGTVFFNQYRDQYVLRPGEIMTHPETPGRSVISTRFVNGAAGGSGGSELAATWSLRRWWKLQGNASWLRVRKTWRGEQQNPIDYLAAFRSPSRQVHASSQMNLPGKVELDALWFGVGQIPRLAIPAYHRLDLRLGWKASHATEFSLTGRNLLDPRRPEFRPEGLASPLSARRSIYGTVVWRF